MSITAVSYTHLDVYKRQVPVLCDKNIVNCDFFDADLIVLPGGMPGAATLGGAEVIICFNLFVSLFPISHDNKRLTLKFISRIRHVKGNIFQ